MTGALYEGDHGFYLACAARILDDSKELAWAEKYYIANPMHKFIVGRYVESDKANFNRQHFTFDNLKFGQPTLAHAPVNLNHGPTMVGAFVASEIVYPTQAAGADDAGLNPYMDALSVFWKHYFEDEYAIVETAHRASRLFYSMECLPQEIACTGDNGCGLTFEYGGRQSPGYCAHLNDPTSGVIKDLIKPHFTAGALIIPPSKPGWGSADIRQISEHIVKEHAEAAETLFNQIAEESPEGDPHFWEQVMAFILLKAEAGDELAKMKKKKMGGY